MMTMFNNTLAIVRDFFTEEERNKMVVDFLYNKKKSFPPKSDIGRTIKNAIKQANKDNDWYFNLDRIEHIKLYHMDSLQPSAFPVSAPVLERPLNKGYHQKQRKIVAFSKINDNVENVYGGDLIIKRLETGIDQNITNNTQAGDLIIFPAFVPFHILPVQQDERAIYLQCIIQGLSFR